jgi:hypothetical protein
MILLKYKTTGLLVIGIILLLSCGKKSAETASIPSEVDTAKYQKVDSVTLTIPRSALRDTVLTIVADSVNALYYPNTGRVVMKLKRGDVCNITRTGRYDVVNGKGNFWVRVERFGGKGWIFGGHTTLESDVWVFSDGMTELGHPYIKYKLNKLSAADFSDLFSLIGKTIKGAEYSEDEDDPGSRKVDWNDEEIIVTEDNNSGTTITESFKPGPATDSIQSINYTYSEEGDNKVTFNHTFIISRHGSKVFLVRDFFGELKEIHRVGRNHVLVADYDLFSSRLGNVHYTNVEVWSPAKKSIITRQRFADNAVETTGLPIFRPSDDGSFISSGKCTFTEPDGKLTMEIFETYNRVNTTDKVEEKMFFITRYFTFNEATNHFEEAKQEVIYQAK